MCQKSAEDQQLPITYHYADYLTMDLDKQYDSITMIYCDFGALSASDRKRLLENIYQHLKPTGKVLLDVFRWQVINHLKKSEFGILVQTEDSGQMNLM
ncbi:class I SAM-dependent methyltransferase [Enterococcus mundtii]|nr:class I SAM-dependent methyltransferase [Enterococcus mundtii]